MHLATVTVALHRPTMMLGKVKSGWSRSALRLSSQRWSCYAILSQAWLVPHRMMLKGTGGGLFQPLLLRWQQARSTTVAPGAAQVFGRLCTGNGDLGEPACGSSSVRRAG